MTVKDSNFTHKDGVSLKEHLESRLKNIEDIIELRFKSEHIALKLASDELDRRLEGMNEFREQLNKQANTFITRAEHDLICREIESLKLSRAELQGKASQSSVMWAYIIAAVGILVAVLSFIL